MDELPGGAWYIQITEIKIEINKLNQISPQNIVGSSKVCAEDNPNRQFSWIKKFSRVAIEFRSLVSKNPTINVVTDIRIGKKRGLEVEYLTKDSMPKQIDITERLKLQYGENTIRVTVTDLDGMAKNELIRVLREKERGDMWGVVIGINQYQNTRDLKYAVNDAKAFEGYLTEYIGISEENIFPLCVSFKHDVLIHLSDMQKLSIAEDSSSPLSHKGLEFSPTYSSTSLMQRRKDLLHGHKTIFLSYFIYFTGSIIIICNSSTC